MATAGVETACVDDSTPLEDSMALADSEEEDAASRDVNMCTRAGCGA